MSARRIAFEVLRRVEEGGAFASRALDAALEAAGAIDPREAGLATELTYGTLRRALTLDAALAPHSRRAIGTLDPAARVALRLGAYQLLFLGTAAHAAVGETVGLVKAVDAGRAAGFVNAVLRALSRAPRLPEPPPLGDDPAGHVAVAESLPRFVAEEWVAWLGAEEALALARAMNQPAPLCVRSPRRDELLEKARAAGLAARPAARSPHGAILSGAPVRALARAAQGVPFQVQDEGAQLAGLYAAGHLAGSTGARVLDACAAPGGKTFHLAELVGPHGEVVAVELHPRKADQLRDEAARRGYRQVKVICADASQPLPGLAPASFDAVLCDAPCAGLGTLRRHPELKLRRTAEDLARAAGLQRAIAANALRYARPGAPFTYAICSLSRAEGPALVQALVDLGFSRLPPPAGFPADALTAEGDLLTLPSRHDCDGFYAARLAAR
ncbi:transcription antitermination factor NusB [Anaeromyxobacter paludicola]|uniref:Ribosomal RNA small subunit methyltransferase B n=1 Tax=Anaeromyxobacter paludicola TaxID=2918171 RepID=A0ABM7XBP5_9BACT|nr:transcription antitermination factor NusB [Anaeromyxobacter paludicola]BDG09268.1 ribosomal RNA small subunit methyltransferase B [Anaeromyxobacter paludicola]